MQFDQLSRRDFITLLGSAAAAWPLTARAQQDERVRQIGVLMATAENDPQYRGFVVAFYEGLQKLGWVDGRNVRIDTRWAALDMQTTKPNARPPKIREVGEPAKSRRRQQWVIHDR